ncbi:DUF3164 family protein [Aurantimonas sp. 22II-16-19i]|uniref:DUF3164 family protein n=1 Tax=Aurantimonas sp. 22II-16-19i TaxID=1317114 RepID=UPI0009F7F0B6|nr:DUF3164 family protein [Aurantimonas sp. 22II-16-19i]ORE98683.1 hypothetical protein ATO4_04185 [Aurantimonas sp. 22II-16-19i]
MSATAATRPETQTTEPKTVRPAGAIEAAGKVLWPDSKGRFTPEEMIKAEDRIEDEMVRKILGHAQELSAQIARFKAHTFADIGDFQAVLDQEYGAQKGGAKGNVTFLSYDGLLKVQVQVADLIEFGPQLQTAKKLIDECLNEWAADARPELKAIVLRAFNTDNAGQVNRTELYRLRRWDIEDARWQRAMQAIADAARAVGSKEYVRFYERDTPEGGWRAVTIDLASA